MNMNDNMFEINDMVASEQVQEAIDILIRAFKQRHHAVEGLELTFKSSE